MFHALRMNAVFQSTLPLRGATPAISRHTKMPLFQSTLPLRGATLRTEPRTDRGEISIHAPLAGSDLVVAVLPLNPA